MGTPSTQDIINLTAHQDSAAHMGGVQCTYHTTPLLSAADAYVHRIADLCAVSLAQGIKIGRRLPRPKMSHRFDPF